MQATLFWACAVAPNRVRLFAHAQNDLIWTAADATELDHAAAPNGGSCMHLPRVLLTVRHDTIHHRADCAGDIGACGADQRPNGPPCPHR
jgi:hypothetical protein